MLDQLVLFHIGCWSCRCFISGAMDSIWSTRCSALLALFIGCQSVSGARYTDSDKNILRSHADTRYRMVQPLPDWLKQYANSSRLLFDHITLGNGKVSRNIGTDTATAGRQQSVTVLFVGRSFRLVG